MRNSRFNDAHLASFQPFDALEGFTELCQKKMNNKHPEVRPELCYDQSEELNEKLSHIKNNSYVWVTYWQGQTCHLEGYVSKLNVPQGGFKVNQIRLEFNQIITIELR